MIDPKEITDWIKGLIVTLLLLGFSAGVLVGGLLVFVVAWLKGR